MYLGDETGPGRHPLGKQGSKTEPLPGFQDGEVDGVHHPTVTRFVFQCAKPAQRLEFRIDDDALGGISLPRRHGIGFTTITRWQQFLLRLHGAWPMISRHRILPPERST